MNYHLPVLHLTACLISFSLLIISFILRKKLFKKREAFGNAAMIFLFIYTLIIAVVIIIKYSYWSELQSFDINGNGTIDGTEITKKTEAAIQVFSRDTGMTFAPFTSIFYALIVSVTYYLLSKVFNKT